ncbi:CDGSH iron-sulfur domain-containing protein [Cupriavidus sp. CV2]|uniref:CDGSH iron-sulfur domain-containing protein n=1 Tax=Cupriavidus TaxID=106589 RepID=UPI00296AECB1|nr:CDGSH iron-sulfur domain-containing protein [Cupriavidus sp. CV2]MDW3681006.1 CDGSH iron-sulfur domain-containing protein [Cupriavidus sp. CV2]
MATESVAGKRVIVLFDDSRCIHSRHCVLDRPDVFEPGVQGEWIHPDNATAEEIAEIAHNCPSGAISYQNIDGSPGEAAPLVNVVRVLENGPLALRAAITIDGQPAGFRLTLCRCGASRNKPLCDSSHASTGFVASGEAATVASEPLAQRDGPLDIHPIPNGPLRVKGNLEVISGTGRTITRMTEAWFCRCGQSGNKPFCDGTHKKVGFRSDPQDP